MLIKKPLKLSQRGDLCWSATGGGNDWEERGGQVRMEANRRQRRLMMGESVFFFF